MTLNDKLRLNHNFMPQHYKITKPTKIKKGGNSQGDIDAKYKTTVLGRKGAKKMSRYDEKCAYDAVQDKMAEYREQQREAMRSACENCDSHKTLGCLYYDPEEETFDYEECFRDSGGWE